MKRDTRVKLNSAVIAVVISIPIILCKVRAEHQPKAGVRTLTAAEIESQIAENNKVSAEPVDLPTVTVQQPEPEPEMQEVNIPILESVPFDRELQEWVCTYSTEHGVSPYLVYAVCWRESRYTIDVSGDNGESHGLMQIKVKFHQERIDRLGITDLYDAKQNIMVGIDYLNELLNWREDTTLEWALMAYNGGPDYADEMTANGKVSEYALEVINKLNELWKESEEMT